MKIGILECDHVPNRLRHIGGDYSDMFANLLRHHAPTFELEYFDICHGQLPLPEVCDAFICTGSRYSSYDQIDWILRLKHLIRQFYDADIPFVGICFGHQLLAEALGGQTARAPEGWG